MVPALAMQMSSPAERGGDVFGERGYILVARGVADAGENVQGGVDAVRELMARPLAPAVAKAREVW